MPPNDSPSHKTEAQAAATRTRGRDRAHGGPAHVPDAPQDAARRPRFGRVRHQRAFEQICDQIRREVGAGTLAPGDRLPPERELAEEFGVSRTAVREALRTLEMAGIIYCQQGIGGGSFIKDTNSNAVTQAVQDAVLLGQIPSSDITNARILVTELAIREACKHATEADFLALERDIDLTGQLTREGNFSRRFTYITEFYRILGRATHNAVLVILVDSLSEIVRRRMEKASPVPRSDVIEVRRRVVASLRRRDAEAATREMTAHFRRLDKYVEQQVRAAAQKRE